MEAVVDACFSLAAEVRVVLARREEKEAQNKRQTTARWDVEAEKRRWRPSSLVALLPCEAARTIHLRRFQRHRRWWMRRRQRQQSVHASCVSRRRMPMPHSSFPPAVSGGRRCPFSFRGAHEVADPTCRNETQRGKGMFPRMYNIPIDFHNRYKIRGVRPLLFWLV